MKLNLSILMDDLKQYAPKGNFKSSKTYCRLNYVVPAPENARERFRQDVLYVVSDKWFETLSPSMLTNAPCFACCGTPPSWYLASNNCNVIWFERKMSETFLLTKLIELFQMYNDWDYALQDAIAQNKPIRFLGELSSKVFRRPIWAWDRHYQTIFHIVNENLYTLPKGYITHTDFTPWPLWEINAWNTGEYISVSDIMRKTQPYILPSTHLFPYRALACNLFIDGTFAGVVTVDEIENALSDRDYVLLDNLAKALSNAIRYNPKLNYSAPTRIIEAVDRLLKREVLPSTALSALLNSIGWNVSEQDGYTCLAVRPKNAMYSTEMLTLVGTDVCKENAGIIHTVHNEELVLIANMRIAKLPARDLVEAIQAKLKKEHCHADIGVSTMFSSITQLHGFRMQASSAIDTGLRNDRQSALGDVYYFESYMLDFIIDRCATRVAPETLCPTGLAKLMEHDRLHGDDLTEILGEYLDNNMQAAETSRNLFMHRNTLVKKLSKIREIMGINLKDPSTRLLVMLSLRIMKDSTIESECFDATAARDCSSCDRKSGSSSQACPVAH